MLYGKSSRYSKQCSAYNSERIDFLQTFARINRRRITKRLAKVGQTEVCQASDRYFASVIGWTLSNPPAVFCYALSSAGCISFTSNSFVLLSIGNGRTQQRMSHLRQAPTLCVSWLWTIRHYFKLQVRFALILLLFSFW